MFCLYQSGGTLLGVGETINQVLEDARGYLEGKPGLLDELGVPLDVEEYMDFTRVAEPGLEVTGELYLRRCSLALFEEAYTTPDRSAVPYHIWDNGVVGLGTPQEGTP